MGFRQIPIKNQWFVGGQPASGYVLKAYLAGTTTNTPLYTDYTGATQANQYTLNSEGITATDSGAAIYPHVQDTLGRIKLVLFNDLAAANDDDTSQALFVFDQLDAGFTLSEGVNSQLVNYLPTYTDAEQINLRNYLMERSVSITQFYDSGTDSDYTAAFTRAKAASRFIFVPQGTYEVVGFDPGNRYHYIGVGNREAGSVLTCSTVNRGIFEFTALAESNFYGINFAATALGVAAFRDTSGTFNDYMQNCDVINCVFDQSLRYGIYANLILAFIHRCNFMQFGADLGQDRTAIHSEWNGGAKTVNDNVVSNCNIYNTQGTNGAIYLVRGFNFELIETTFENLTGPAIRALGVDNVRMQGGWIEDVEDATHAIDAELSTVGTRVFLDGVKIDNSNATAFASLISLDSACFARVDNCNGNMNSANLTLKGGVADSGLLGSRANNFTNYSGEYADTDFMQKLVIRGSLQPFVFRQTSLSDNPGSPEVVATFATPTTPSGQEGYTAAIDVELSVIAVATDTTRMAFNQQKGRIVLAVSKAGTVTASLDTSIYTAVNTTEGGGGWTSAPIWSLNVSGTDVQLLMTSNPLGGSFFEGITAFVTGTIHNHDSSLSGNKLLTYS